MERYKKYIERNDLKNATHLEVSVSYRKVGVTYSNGKTMPRGYYLTVTPVTQTEKFVSFTMFTGQSYFLLETKRFSAKQFAKAIEMSKDYEEELITAVVARNKAA